MRKLSNVLFFLLLTCFLFAEDEIKNLKLERDYEKVILTWDIESIAPVKNIEILASDTPYDPPKKKIKTVEGNQKSCEILKVKPLAELNYKVKLVFEDGKKSKGLQVTGSAKDRNLTEITKNGKNITLLTDGNSKPEEIKYPYIERISGDDTYNNSFMLITTEGTTVAIDPNGVINGLKADVILSTHEHGDHNDANFLKNNPQAKVSLYKEDDFTFEKVHIYSVESSHNDDTIPSNPRNFIYVIEADGKRIAHMGDIGQTKLTDEQMKKIGKIDVAFMQFENPYSNMDMENKKGFNLIKQLNPQIIVPTHATMDSKKSAGDLWGKFETIKNGFSVEKKDREVIDIVR